MSRVTAAMLIGLFAFALQARATDAWFDGSTPQGCSIDGSLRDGDSELRLAMYWFRESKKPPTIVMWPSRKTFGHRGSISIVSPSLAQPLNLTAAQEFGAHGPSVDAFMTDVANVSNWHLVLHPDDGSERRLDPRLQDGARVFAMFKTCRSVASRAATPAPVAGRVRAKGATNQVFGTACDLATLYKASDIFLTINLERRNGATSVKLTSPDESLHVDLTSLGGPADAAGPDVPDVKLSDLAANLLVTELMAGAERLVPVRSANDASRALVFGGPEYAVEAAMFKACTDVR